MKRLLIVLGMLLMASPVYAVDITALPDLGHPATASDSVITYDQSAAEESRITERKFSGTATDYLDGTGAFDAIEADEVVYTPAGNISAVTTEGAINELDDEKQPLDNLLTDIAALVPSTGDIWTWDGANIVPIGTSNAGQVIVSGGAGVFPYWKDRIEIDTANGLSIFTATNGPLLSLSEASNSAAGAATAAQITAVEANSTTSVNVADFDDFMKFFSGSFQETFDALVTSDGATITMSLQSTAAGDLTMRFSDGRTALDCTPAKTIALTAGTGPSPQANYIYILQSDKILTKSTTQWPAAEHIKIAYFSVQTAALVQTYGAVINQNHNDGAADDAGQGHLTHMGQWIRSVGAKYFSGVDGAGTDDYITPYAGGGYFKVSAGVVTQMHRHTVPAVDTQTGGIALCPNYPSDAFKVITDLNDLLLDSAGGSLTGRYYNIIIGGVANKSGEFAPLMVKLPSGSYNSSAGAVDDVDTYTDYAMPRAFNKESSTGFLIARVTIRNQSDTTFTIVQTQDLRGTDGALPAGSTGGGSLLTFPDSQFKVYNNTDPTKIIDLDVSAITPGNTRTIIMADADVDLGALGTASIRNAEDTLTDGANLPDGAAVIAYGDANWGGGSMTWPTVAGIPYWTTGTAWGGAYTLVTTIGDPGSDTNIPSEQAVREAFSSLAFNMSGAESNLLWNTGVNYLDHLYTLAIGSKEMAWTIYDSDVDTAVADGKQAFPVPSSYVGFNLVDVTCSVADLNSAASGTTTVVLRRVRGATAVDMTSTGVTIAYTEYTASDETVDTANDDLALGDMIYVDINAITTAVQKGLSCSAVFRLP